MRKPVVVLGIPIDTWNMSESLDRIVEMVQVGRATGRAHQVATVNTDFVVKAQDDPELRYLLQRADLLTADGMPLVWGIRWLGVPLEGRVAGSDMIPALAGRAAQCGLSIYFLGGMPGVAEKAASRLRKMYPGLQVAGVYSPPFSPILEMDTSFLADIRSAHPDILLVAFGNPKQEKWIGMHGKNLGVPVLIGVGATLDFLAGYTRRAPGWMQRSGTEWLFRLLQEPRRLFRRYLVDLVVYVPSLVRQCFLLRRVRKAASSPQAISTSVVQGSAVLTFQGSLSRNSLDALNLVSQQALEQSPHILADLSKVTFLDSSAAGFLLELGSEARAVGGELSFVSVPEPVLQIFRFLKIEDLFPIYPDISAYQADCRRRESPGDALHSVQKPDQQNGQCWTVLKAGRVLDASASQEFLETGARLLSMNPFLACDLSETKFLLSAGLAAISQLRQIAEHRDGGLRVIHCSADAQRVIRNAGFHQILSLCDDFPRQIHDGRKGRPHCKPC